MVLSPNANSFIASIFITLYKIKKSHIVPMQIILSYRRLHFFEHVKTILFNLDYTFGMKALTLIHIKPYKNTLLLYVLASWL